MTFRWPRIELCCKKKIVNLFVFTFPAAVGENSLTEHLCVISITVRGQTLLMDGSSAWEKCVKAIKTGPRTHPWGTPSKLMKRSSALLSLQETHIRKKQAKLEEDLSGCRCSAYFLLFMWLGLLLVRGEKTSFKINYFRTQSLKVAGLMTVNYVHSLMHRQNVSKMQKHHSFKFQTTTLSVIQYKI